MGKLLRQVQEGRSVDVEVLEHLNRSERRPNVPQLLGAVEARRPRDRTSTLFVLQRYVPNEGDAWQVTIDQAQDFFERVLVAPFAGKPHPRTYGSTAQVLGTYVRDRGALPLETAVAKLTSASASAIGLRDRGVIREGALADLVVFDATTIADVATYADPSRHPVGIDHVVVNGRVAVRDGAETGERAGRLLRRG